MSRFFNSKYAGLTAYTPGEQPKDMEYIKLNTNESPYPPSQEVIDAINAEEVLKLRLYPDPTGSSLKMAIAEQYGVGMENVYIDNGSDDILNFAFMAFGGDGKKVYFPEISYGFYKVFAEQNGIEAVPMPLEENFSIDYSQYFGLSGLIVIANPNAPTGLSLSVENIEEILKKSPDSLVVIDEAYVDFGADSAVGLTKEYDNLLVVQTFSKSRSMAGARLGFAIGNVALIEDLETLKFSTNPYNVNRLSMIAGVAAIRSQAYYDDNCEKIIRTRQFTYDALCNMGFYVIPSKANFLFAKTDEISGEELYLKLKARGVLIRHFDNPKICQFNRITIGTREQMETFIKEVENTLKEKVVK